MIDLVSSYVQKILSSSSRRDVEIRDDVPIFIFTCFFVYQFSRVFSRVNQNMQNMQGDYNKLRLDASD